MTVRRKILVVDDHADSARLVARLLILKGHQATTANTLAEALKLCKSESFDVALIDLELPDGSGVELGRYLETECRIPCVAYTGYDRGTAPKDLGKFDFVDYLLKPAGIDQITQVLTRALLRRPPDDIARRPAF